MSRTVSHETLIISAGAAGLFCAALLAKCGGNVRILDNGKKVGRKILMSGGGFCNFTNMEMSSDRYLSQNPHFVKSALKRFTQWDFIGLVADYSIAYHEKELGQLFCDNGAEDIVNMLLAECKKYGVEITLRQHITSVEKTADGFCVTTNGETLHCRNLVVATGGLSMPGLGATPFGYQLAQQFGINVIAPRASLVPFTWRECDQFYAALSGISLDVAATNRHKTFTHQMLFTHRGLSGPAILQISNYWQPGESIHLDLLPYQDIRHYLDDLRQSSPKLQLKTALARLLPKKLVELWLDQGLLQDEVLARLSKVRLENLVNLIHNWQFVPNGTEGYRTAEVTMGGVDTHAISSKTMESNQVGSLYFIGEVLDVTGWLGGYNFQWAWSSAYACAQAIAEKG
ncbi:BaiN/RdsA family NAD(P)/FAD-dependent oxidoreductase [Aggregatibacter actinomycetemcomitans]|uniref:NAD(P)/FAD-dependent oxidoreductase n=1 Tax=Aggregatibacter actinomycetemcomitans TaxID=714 RepID=UPI0011D84C9B|nr:NAD(P)/FAD-dependent oxidoreductase [Aggregatibacter actinomycetemcomitans]TYB23013.1 NAD(P)/FAD-dependent oxidoreductase [Aggregatibacter actinomycetemcomitans]